MLVTRTGWTGELGFEIYSDKDTDHMALWNHLLASGKAFGMENAGLEVMGVRRVEAGILDNGTDIDRSMTPFDIGLEQFVDFTKSDFVGRDALEGASKQARLFGIVSEAGVPRVGAIVMKNQKEIGQVRVGDWSPTLKMGIAYVLFDKAVENIESLVGEALMFKNPAEDVYQCKVVNLPFYDAKKQLPRGLPIDA